MVNSVSSNAARMNWQSMQAVKTAQPAAPVSPVSPASSVRADAASPVKARYDTVQISAEGQAYASQTAPSTQAGPGASDSAALLKQLNTADSSGTSYLQRQMASLRAGVSAAALLGGSASGSFGGGSAGAFGGSSALDMNSLMTSYTQSRQNNIVLRNAGASALGVQPPQFGAGSAESTEKPGDAEEGASADLSKYSLGELSKLLSSGEITTEQYLAEGAKRQEQSDAAKNAGAVSAAMGAA